MPRQIQEKIRHNNTRPAPIDTRALKTSPANSEQGAADDYRTKQVADSSARHNQVKAQNTEVLHDIDAVLEELEEDESLENEVLIGWAAGSLAVWAA